jgi:drug/metabolite transporter (DMT)-like permease
LSTPINSGVIITLSPVFLAVFGYFFLKEKVNLKKILGIIIGFSGAVFLIINSSKTGINAPNIPLGNSFFLLNASAYAGYLIVVKDMVPAQFVAGVCSCLIGFLLSTKIMISPNDIFLGFLAGFFQVGFGFIFITIGARTTPSAMVGIIMLSESVLGPN